MTAEEYRKMLDTDFADVELEELTDISVIQIDRGLPLEQRKQQYLKKVGNPYLVRVGSMKVKVRFTGGISFNEAFENMLLSLYRKLRFLRREKEQEFTKHMLDKLLSGNNDRTTRFRRYKNLPLQPRHQISRLHLRNNPYQEGHPRSCGVCPRMSCLRVDYPYIFCVVSLCLGS